MALTHAKDRYPWRTGEIVSAVVLAFIAAGIMTAGIAFDQLALYGLIGPIAVFLFILYVVRNFQVKRNRTLNVELNDDSGYFNVWMNKENRALWGDKLKRDRNQGDLHELRSIAYQKVGVYGVYAFNLKDGTNLYLPERGMKPEVADFFRKWILGPMNGKVNFNDKESSKVFLKAIDMPERV